MEIDELAARVSHEGPRITEAELADFDASLGRPLPEDFRRFVLLSGGGGELDEALEFSFEIQKHLGPVRANGFVELFCAPGGDEYHSVRPLYRHIEDMEYVCAGVPRDIYVIADDWSGNFLTIDLRPETYGQVGLVDHETVGDHFDDFETYFVVAPSFSAFVAGLRVPEETD
jgi:cell wall assembly regulator SMI1